MDIRLFKFSIQASIAMLTLLFCMHRSSSQPASRGDSSAIHSQFSKFQEALRTRDTLSLGNFYTEDAISLRQNESVRRGRDSIIKRWKKSLSNPILIRVTSNEVKVLSGGYDAFQFGVFEVHTADTSNSLLASGKIIFLWKKQSDGWRIALEMDNFNSVQSPKSPVQTKQ